MAKDNSCGWPIVNKQSWDPDNTDFIKPPGSKNIWSFFLLELIMIFGGKIQKGKKSRKSYFNFTKHKYILILKNMDNNTMANWPWVPAFLHYSPLQTYFTRTNLEHFFISIFLVVHININTHSLSCTQIEITLFASSGIVFWGASLLAHTCTAV